MKILVVILTLLLAPSVESFVPIPAPAAERSDCANSLAMRGVVDNRDIRIGDGDTIIDGAPTPSGVQRRREVFKTGSLIVASILGSGSQSSQAAEQKIYSSNARNMARLSDGDSSGGSIYDNNPSSPKARARRAIVGCKNSSAARSLAAENIGKRKLSEKECNMMVMSGDTDFMLEALTKLDCPTCPYGIKE
ncbi:hypothetical protein ACHAXR_004103 [Thalassiosira sp. AJA248-18]